MSKLPTQSDNPSGLHARYQIKKWVRSPYFNNEYIAQEPNENAEYFVLRLDVYGKDIEHIKACRIGINAYADAIYNHLPDLSNELKARYPLL